MACFLVPDSAAWYDVYKLVYAHKGNKLCPVPPPNKHPPTARNQVQETTFPVQFILPGMRLLVFVFANCTGIAVSCT
eukprot:1663833-Rhodomonas_salina.1